MPLISVFTPTYNRAEKIHRVFNSLKNQTLQDFEWIIVDDGSTDHSKDIIDQFIGEEPGFPIIYFAQPNGGKHIAINKGVALASGEWFHIADSDDALEPKALEIFMNTWKEIPEDEKPYFCGVVACCKDQFGNRISDQVPGKYHDGHFREMFYKHSFRKEAVMINKTAVIRQFPFPEFIRNCYFPEAIIWKPMTEKYPVRFINDEIRIYYVDDGHSLMSQKIRLLQSRALPNCLETSSILNGDLSYFIYAPLFFFRNAIVYHCFLPFLNKDERKWVLLRPAAKAFAFPFIIAGFVYNKILSVRTNNKLQATTSNAE